VMDTNHSDFDALEARLTDPSIPLKSARHVATDAAASAAGREFLLREYGSTEVIERAMIAPGRPHVGERSGASPAVRGRITPTDYAAFKKLEEQTGRSQSDLVREAVHQLLRRHKLIS